MKDRRPIRQRLSDFYTEAELDLWIHRPQPLLGDVSARHLVDQGRADEVHRLIDQLEEGVYL